MATHADLGAKLLRDAALFFRGVAEQNPSMKEQMEENADVFEQVAELLEIDPLGKIDLEEEDAAGSEQ